MTITEFTAAVTALIVTVTMTACGSTANNENVVTTESSSQTVTVQQSDYLKSEKPEPIMIDNVADLIQINGKTITMPTTLNTLSECIEGSSYEVTPEFLDKYGSEKNILDAQGKLFFDLDKDNVLIFRTFIIQEDYTKDIGECAIKNLNLSKKDFSENDLSFSMPCGIDFTSTRQDVIDVFGEPNVRTTDTYLEYYLMDSKNNECIFKFDFGFQSDEMTGIVFNGYV